MFQQHLISIRRAKDILMSTTHARTGRQNQRYIDQFRLVAGCIPYKYDETVETNVLVLMISAPNRDDLVFPKGGWEDDETLVQAASREAMEEAGVQGIVNDSPLGTWEFRSKSSENSCSTGGSCRGYMFALKVTEELDFWPGQTYYVRKWLTIDQAYKHCRYDWMREALNRFMAVV